MEIISKKGGESMANVKEKKTAKPKEEVQKEELEVAAYFHWLERGCPSDDALTDWVEVENKFPASYKHN
jgi:hypothetical protein